MNGRTREVLEAVAALTLRGGPITNTHITRHTGLQRQNVRAYLLTLARLGLINYEAEERRFGHVTLTDAGREELGIVSQPSQVEHGFPILGEVAAGQPVLAEPQAESFAVRLADVLDLHPGDFLLKVRGESMTGIGIFPGDLVAIRPGEKEPLDGTVTLVGVPGEHTATLKRWHRQGKAVTLTSENPDVPPLTFSANEVQVQGYFIGHIGTGRPRHSFRG